MAGDQRNIIETYDWDDGSTYVRNPPYFTGMQMEVDEGRVTDITGARMLAKLGDLDHHRPHLAGGQHQP